MYLIPLRACRFCACDRLCGVRYLLCLMPLGACRFCACDRLCGVRYLVYLMPCVLAACAEDSLESGCLAKVAILSLLCVRVR